MSFVRTTKSNDDDSNENRERLPRVFVILDQELHRMRLVQNLAQSDCRVIEVLPNAKLPDDIENVEASPDLFVFPIDDSDPSSLERIRGIHAHNEFRDVPILGLAHMKQLCMGLDELRNLGVVGVADCKTSVEHIVFRINQLVRPSLQRRRWERADVFITVELELDGVSTSEIALNLSAGGIGLRCSRKVDVNTDVRIAIAPDDGAALRLEGRVVQSADDSGVFPRNRIAVVFYPTEAETTARLERAVSRLRCA